jgi:Ca2+-binding RTX toxin-like protein
MAKDSQLLNLVRAFTQQIQQANYVGIESTVQVILYQWAGINGNVTDRGPYIDARKIAFLEKFFDQDYVEVGLGSSRLEFSGPVMNTVFDNLFKALSRRLVAQTLSSSVTYDLLTDRFTYNRKEEIVNQFARLSQPSTPLNELHANLLVQILEEESGVIDSDLNGNDIISGGAENDTINGQGGNDIINGQLGNDMLDGGAGNDIINAGFGWDTVDGGIDNDILIVDYSSNTHAFSGRFQERLAGITTTISSNGTGGFNGFYQANTDNFFGYDKIQFSNIERFRIIGTVATDYIITGDSNDTISGGYGKDTLFSGDGDDLVFGGHGDDFLKGSSGNDTLKGDIGSDQILGEIGDDSLEGGDGNDTLDGGSGSDTLNGGTGNDIYFVDSISDIVWEASGIDSGFDRVESTVTYTLSDNIESLTLAFGTNAIDGTGNSLDNEIVGNNGINRLFGMTGNDYLRGLAGDDTLAGGEGNDGLEGDDGNDRLEGGDGNDILDGGNGNDTMIGGLGNDRYYVNSSADVLQEASTLTTEIDSVDSSISYTLGNNLENLALVRNAANGTGNSLNNFISGNSLANRLLGIAGNDTLDGGSGNDTLDGGSGNDTLIGGTGNDSYFVDSTGDVIQEISVISTEIDIITSTITYILGDNLENLTLAGTNTIDGTGNILNNLITGNSVANRLFGLTGNDTLDGAAGNDILDGGDGNDSLTGGDGIDTLLGGLGNDILTGRAGNDTLTGGGGIDHFLYDTNAIFNTSAIGVDRLTDFTLATDKIILDKTTFTALRSVTGVGLSITADFASVANDTVAATSAAFITYSRATGNLFYNQNGTAAGLGTGAQFATLSGLPNLSTSDFIVQA